MKRLMTKPLTLALRWMLAALCIVFVTGFTASILPAQPPGGPGGPNSADKKIVKEFDKDGNGVLNREERDKARAFLKKEAEENASGRRGMGRRGGRFGSSRPTGKPGPKVSTSDVEFYPDAELYDPKVLRTFFLEFEQDDWEEELAAFKPTDVEVPATLTVDGKVYPNVGVSFRGASSFFMIPEGGKRSLNLSMDFIDDKQKLYGYKSLNLLNGSGDASMMSSYLYSNISSQKIATTKVNYVKVVINGRSWGIYVNSQQFNKDFVKENFDTRKGNRWKVSGNPRGDAGLRYIGDNVEDYKAKYEIKSKDRDQAWADLIHLCKVLNETPADQLVEKLDPILDLDGVLWFLAVDVATINSDGYWTRASDYSIYQDTEGKFHVLPHDMNEAFRAKRGGRGGGRMGGRRGGGFGGPPPQGGPPREGGPPPEGFRGPPPEGGPPPERGGFGGRPQERGGPPRDRERREGRERPQQRDRGAGRQGQTMSGGYDLDPLVGIDQDRFPLRSKLLANPTLRTRYLQYLHLIAREHLTWPKMRPLVKDARQLIASDVKADTRKLMATESFMNATDLSKPAKPGSLREFSEMRSQYLLNHPAIKDLPRELVELPSDSKQNKKKKKK